MLVASLAALSSCRDGAGARLSLRLADSLMETRPDSSLAVLRRDSALFSSASLRLRMAYAVSRAEAEDKLYVPHRSDSAVLPAAEYFARYGSALESVRSWYVLGRVYSDMLLYGRALSAFDNAVSVEARPGRACGQALCMKIKVCMKMLCGITGKLTNTRVVRMFFQ